MSRRWGERCSWELTQCSLPRKTRKNGKTCCMDKLPDDLISHVASFLTIRDATRTKALSRRFRFIGASLLHDLDFDWPNMCETPLNYFEKWTSHLCITYKSSFVKAVNQFLDNYLGCNINTFRISFCLGREYSLDVDRWVSFAIRLGVENLKLSFSCHRFVSFFDGINVKKSAEHKASVYLIFPCHLLIPPGRKSNLMYLTLQSCIFVPEKTHQFSSITTLKLYDVPLSETNLQTILTCFLNLECLGLESCNLPFKLSVYGSVLRLKSLLVLYCFDVKEIELLSPNLTTFEYAGEMLKFDLGQAPNLKTVYYQADKRCTMGLGYMFNLLGKHVPRIKVLSIYTEARWVRNMPTTLIELSCLKQLDLFLDPIDARSVVTILKACPVLEKFYMARTDSLNLICPKRNQPVELGRCADSFNLKEVVISGFAATTSEVAIAVCLMETAPNLEKMVLDAAQRVYHGDGVWKRRLPYMYSDEERDKLINMLKERAASRKAVITMVGRKPFGMGLSFHVINYSSELF